MLCIWYFCAQKRYVVLVWNGSYWSAVFNKQIAVYLTHTDVECLGNWIRYSDLKSARAGRSPISLQLLGPFLDINDISPSVFAYPNLTSLLCYGHITQLDGNHNIMWYCYGALWCHLMEIKHCQSSLSKMKDVHLSLSRLIIIGEYVLKEIIWASYKSKHEY